MPKPSRWTPFLAVSIVLGLLGLSLSATWLATWQARKDAALERLEQAKYRIPAVWDSVVGFTFSMSIKVEVFVTDEQSSRGSELHYKQYRIVCTESPTISGDTRTVTPVTKRYDPTISGQVIWADSVGKWFGTPWNDNGFIKYSVEQSEPEPGDDGTYWENKPGRYLTVAGLSLNWEDFFVKQMEVPTYFQFSILGSNGDSRVTKLPFMTTLPRYENSGNYFCTEYRLDFYVGVGGRLTEAITWDISTYQTDNTWRIGYQVDYISLYDLIPWDFPVMNWLFGTHYSTMDVFRLDTEIAPYVVETQPIQVNKVDTFQVIGEA